MRNHRTLLPSLFTVLGIVLLALPLAAQEGDLRPEPPKGATVEEIIQRFAAKEKEFKLARERYTWRQDVMVQTIGDDNRPNGEYRSVFDVSFDDKGRRTEQILFAPQNTLTKCIELTKEDLDDFEKRMPFTMTTDDLPEYNVKYLGQQQEDEINTYVFDIGPKQMLKGKRYFQGRIWVDDRDFQIVKTYGKSVPDYINGKPANEVSEKQREKAREANLFPRFTTWREQIDGKYWFPTYTKVDDVLHFPGLGDYICGADIHMKQVIKYTDYKQFGASSRILYQGQEVQKAPENPPPQTPPKK